MGLLFCGYLYLAWEKAKETRGWAEVECIIEHSEVGWEKLSPNSPVRYHPEIRYRYRYDGQSYTSGRLGRVRKTSQDKRKIEKEIEGFPLGTKQQCFVDPENPEFAILDHAPLAPIYTIWFPMLFVVGGVGMIVGGLRRRPRKDFKK